MTLFDDMMTFIKTEGNNFSGERYYFYELQDLFNEKYTLEQIKSLNEAQQKYLSKLMHNIKLEEQPPKINLKNQEKIRLTKEINDLLLSNPIMKNKDILDIIKFEHIAESTVNGLISNIRKSIKPKITIDTTKELENDITKLIIDDPNITHDKIKENIKFTDESKVDLLIDKLIDELTEPVDLTDLNELEPPTFDDKLEDILSKIDNIDEPVTKVTVKRKKPNGDSYTTTMPVRKSKIPIIKEILLEYFNEIIKNDEYIKQLVSNAALRLFDTIPRIRRVELLYNKLISDMPNIVNLISKSLISKVIVSSLKSNGHYEVIKKN